MVSVLPLNHAREISLSLHPSTEGLFAAPTHQSAVAPELVDIAITIHRLGPDTRELGIALFENLLDINSYSARETLEQIDNRFRNSAPRPRRRLPRRNRERRTRRAAR